jgi:hypothetical protein
VVVVMVLLLLFSSLFAADRKRAYMWHSQSLSRQFVFLFQRE